eukprot:CAMPEP_0119496180 /NCGR_PEP_ID=MMETSP1344-20130328/19589_1 /TAXON_ID=236787 /ORGANISM="Florenciella parvula, Strain CCMP2471" /LENGTH=32 /DNA_ID= /DNA_START= /DNA_END= /DNA_ORIENTATION=
MAFHHLRHAASTGLRSAAVQPPCLRAPSAAGR